MAQRFQFFRQHSVLCSGNDWTMKATTEAVPWREEACAVCAVKDWLENRAEVYLFQEASGTTTWAKQFYAIDDGGDGGMADEEDGGQASASTSQHSAPRTLLVADDGKFCLGPKEKVHPILDVQRYVARWPLIPTAELHASSVQHPDDIHMRWLLHTRRVKCTAEPTPDSLPRCAGVGDRTATVWCCKLCIQNLCTQKPKMPPLALSNDFWLGRHHPCSGK